MRDFSISDGVACDLDPALLGDWWNRRDYQDAVVEALGPAGLDDKRLVMDFEADLGRVVAAGRLGEDLDAVLSRYLVDDYRQHDPTIGQGRVGLARWLREVAVHFPGTPPPPIALTAQGGLVTVLLRVDLPAPEGPGTFFIVPMFRVRGGMLVEHWGGGSP